MREIQNRQVAPGIRRYADFELIRGLFKLYLIALNKAAFCRGLSRVCEAQLRFCVKDMRFEWEGEFLQVMHS